MADENKPPMRTFRIYLDIRNVEEAFEGQSGTMGRHPTITAVPVEVKALTPDDAIKQLGAALSALSEKGAIGP